jgi:O-antigen/teichoic acid export membrane protein
MELKDTPIEPQNASSQEPTLKEKTAKGLFWGGISKSVQQVLAVIIGVILLDNLTPDDYGMIGLLAIFTGIANTIQESGFTVALINRATFKHEDYNSVFWFNIFVSLTIYLFLFFCAPFIARFFKEPDLLLFARVFFLSFVSSSFGIAHNAVLLKKIMAKERAKIDIISVSLSGIVGVYLVVNGYGYWSLAFQTLTYTFTGSMLRWYYSPWKPTFFFQFKPIREMFEFSFKFTVSSIVYQLQSNIYSVVLGRFYTKTYVGYYSQGTKWAAMGAEIFSGTVSGIAQPLFVNIKDDVIKQVQVFRKLLRFIAFVAFPSLLGFAFISREFILLINPEYLPCVPILQLYCLWAITAPISVLYIQMAISFNRSTFYFIQTLVYAFIQIIATVCVFPYGIYWMAFINVLMSYFYLLAWHIYVNRFIPLRIINVLKDIFPYLFISVITIIITHFVTKDISWINLRLILKIIIVMILYIIIVWKSNSMIFKECLDFIFKKKHSS